MPALPEPLGSEPVTQTIDVQQIPIPDFVRSPAPKGMLIGGE